MFASYALSIARRSRGFIAGSAPPRRAATVTSLMSRVKILPSLASAAAFLCFTLAHLECPAMAERRVSSSGELIILSFALRAEPSRSCPNPCGDLRGLLPRHRRRDGDRGRRVLLAAPDPDQARVRLRRRPGHAARAAHGLLAAFLSRGRGLGRARRNAQPAHPARRLGDRLSGIHRVLLRELHRLSGPAVRLRGT